MAYDAEIPDILAAMVSLENAALTSVDQNFQALIWAPSGQDPEQEGGTPDIDGYPRAFRLSVGGTFANRTAPGGGMNVPRSSPRKTVDLTIEVALVVGDPSNNELEELVDLANRMLLPFYAAYEADFHIGRTVNDSQVGSFRMGKIEINGNDHFGLLFPITTRQHPYVPTGTG